MREPHLLGRAMMKADGESVSVNLAGYSERPSIENLLQFYFDDFSEMEPPGSNDMEFGEQGGYSPLPHLDCYRSVEGFRPLLIRLEERLAGFALINTRSRRSGRVEHNMADIDTAEWPRWQSVRSWRGIPVTWRLRWPNAM